jgi:hypothetical protein
MDDNQNVNDDTLNIADEDTEIVLDITDDEEDVDVEALKAQNKKLYERAKKAEGFTKQSDGSWVKTEQPKQITKKAVSSQYNILEDEVADLILGGYSKDETKFILANGGREALNNKDSFVAVAINAKREQRKTEEAVSQTSHKGYSTPGGKTFTEEQLRNMSPEEMERVLPHA